MAWVHRDDICMDFQVLVALKEVSHFWEYNGHGIEVLSIGYTIDRI